MIADETLSFDQTGLAATIGRLPAAELDRLKFGVIGFDASTAVCVYNAFETQAAGLRVGSVVGRPLFKVVAPCMNNALIAHRFEAAARDGVPLDVVVPYVLTLRMRPTRVLLRLIADPSSPLRYVLVQRDV